MVKGILKRVALTDSFAIILSSIQLPEIYSDQYIILSVNLKRFLILQTPPLLVKHKRYYSVSLLFQ